MCSLLEDIVKRSEKARASSEEFQKRHGQLLLVVC